jgi:molybdopterin-guanine dinucleotide biosynthesis protein B
VFGFAGWSGSGKTTLIEKLLPVLTMRGLRVATVKHTHKDFDFDKPGKDSWRHRQAGAREVMIAAPKQWTLVHQVQDEAEAGLDHLLSRMSTSDLVLVEGFKREAIPKLEVHRVALGKSLIAAEDPHIVAIASDAPVATALPRFDLDDVAGIADFILKVVRRP